MSRSHASLSMLISTAVALQGLWVADACPSALPTVPKRLRRTQGVLRFRSGFCLGLTGLSRVLTASSRVLIGALLTSDSV